MYKLNNKFTFGYLKCAKHRKRSAITTRYISKTQELNLSISNILTKSNKILLIAPSMGKWGKAYLPTWLIDLRYSGSVWAKYSVYTLCGKYSLKKNQSQNQKSWKRLIGGCTCGIWADPQQAPPLNFIIEVTSSCK